MNNHLKTVANKPAHTKPLSSSSNSSGFVILPVLLLIALVVVVGKVAYDRSHVLGESSLIAQTPPSGETAPAPQTQSAPQTQESHPQESAPAPQQAPQQSAPAPQQSAPAPQTGTGGSTSTQQWSGSTGQQQYQAPQQGSWGGSTGTQQSGQTGTQWHQPTAEEQKRYQQYQQQGGQQGSSGQYHQPTAEEQKQYEQYKNASPEEQKQLREKYQQQTGSQGEQGQGGQSGQNQPYVPKFSQEQYKEFQKQFQQEAEKRGFQISGSLPPQFLDFQSSGHGGPGGSGNTGTGETGRQGNEGQGNTGNVGQNQGGPGINANTGTKFGNITFFTLPPVDAFPTIQGKFTVGSATGGQEVDLNQANTRIQLWGPQGANSPLAAVRSDGTQVQLDKAVFEKINAAMKLTTGSEVSQSGDKFNLKRGQVEAETHLPISFNVATKTFTVQTPSGEKELHVLPDTAAQALIQNKVFSQLQTTTVAGEGGTTTTQAKVMLTEFNNHPVYEVEGASAQKFLGFATISIPKTVFVSAETGDSVKTEQTFGSQILDLLSF